MTENERQEILSDIKDGYIDAWDNMAIDKLFETIEKEHNEIQQYREMERRLQNIYGECDGLLETVVQHLEKHENIKLPDNIIKARLLTDEDVDKWEQLKTIGTIEELKALKEKSVAKKPNQVSKAMDKDKYVGLIGRCPNCSSIVAEDNLVCEDCFQVLDWSE